MRYKQNDAEYKANIAAWEKSLLPAVLAPTQANWNLMSGYMLSNFANGEFVDVSVANLYKATSSLHAAKLLEWIIAPNQKKVRDDARKTDTNETSVVKEAVEKFDAHIEQVALAECKNIILQYRGRAHSITYKRRDILQAKLDDLLAQKTKPTAIKVALEATVNGFPD